MPTIVPIIVRFLHDVFTATWIGGLILMVLVILPGLKKNPQVKEPKVAVRAVQKRLKVAAIVSMIGLALTGILLSNRSTGFEGLFNFSTPFGAVLSIKHVLMLVMVVLAVIRLVLNKKNESLNSARVEKSSMLVLVVNAICGLVVLFLSAYLSVGF